MGKKDNKEPEDPVAITENLSSSILTEMVNNLEETKLKLLLNIKELKEQLAQQKEDQSDIYFYLNKKCDESFEVIASLEEQILNEQADREIAEKLYENRLEELRTTSLSNEAKLNTKIVELENRLEMLNSFSETKEETESNLKHLMSKLEEERVQFSVNAENMENKFLLEREKLRKSYDVKYENIKAELELSIDGKLSKKTKKTQIMNAVMRKELDAQSKHAERLLEINSGLLQRDREQKLELELANSLSAEMTAKLTMYQRVVKQVNEKVAAQEAFIDAMRAEHLHALTKKEEEIIRLEARANQMNKKNARDNARLDEMWRFIAQSYQMIRAKNHGGTVVGGGGGSSSSIYGGGSVGNVSATSSIESSAPHMDHELLLVELIREVAHRHPKALSGLIAAHGGGASLFSSMADLGDRSVALQPSQSQLGYLSSVVVATGSAATGIPTWDNRHSGFDGASESGRGSKYRNSRYGGRPSRSIGVQTDAKLAAYPLGSSWLETSSVGSIATAGDYVVSGADGPGPGGSVFRSSHPASGIVEEVGSLVDDARSIEVQSMPSLWGSYDAMQRAGATNGGNLNAAGLVGGLSVSSSLDDSSNYTIKTASHAMPQQHGTAPINSKHRALAKIRNGRHGTGSPHPPQSHFRDIEQILSDAAAARSSRRDHSLKGVLPTRDGLQSPASQATSVTGSGNRPGGGPSRTLNNSAPSPLIAVSGQGFVSPFALPKLV